MDYVLITTDKDKRGVFAGYLKEDKSPDYVVLTEVRMAVYWSSNCKGVLGLASTGPMKGSRISNSAPESKIYGVTSITKCTDVAVKQWEKGLWD
jgi:hypothetical protein